MFGSCSSFNDSDEEDDSLPTSSPRPTHCNKNDTNQHYSSRSPRCIFQRSPFLSLQSADNDELMSRLSTLPMLDSVSSTHNICMKQEASMSMSSSKIPPPSPPTRRRIMPPIPATQQLITTTIIPTTEDIKMPQSSSSKRPSGSCLRRSRYSFPSELSEIAARNVDYVLSDSKSVSFYSQVSVLEFENDEDDTGMKDCSSNNESWFKNFSRGFGIES